MTTALQYIIQNEINIIMWTKSLIGITVYLKCDKKIIFEIVGSVE